LHPRTFREAIQRVVAEIGRPEYVIAVHPDDVDRAGRALSNDVGVGRTFSSDGDMTNG
jgi:hypothetical protein